MPTDAIHPSIAAYINSAPIAENYDQCFADMPLFRFDTAVLEELMPEPCKLIDLGCGTGRHVVHFARKGFDVTAVDLSQYMLILSAAKCNENDVRADFHQADLTDLSAFSDGAFDAAICMFSTLGMIRGRGNRVEALRGIHRLLKPGGLFVFHAHNRWHNLYSRDGRKWLLKTYMGGWLSGDVGDRRMADYRGIPQMFLHVFSLAELKRIVAEAGMSIIRTVFLNELRNKELPPGPKRHLKANGFIIACRREG